MATSDAPQDVTKHMLGPHVVGQRIVVRRVLPGETGPSGGPALTDVLGICLSWGDGTCVVQTEDGHDDRDRDRRHRVRQAGPAAAVDPAPGDRRRGPAPRLAMWPDLETEPLGDWILRHSPTSTARRANSVLAIGPSGVADDYERVVAFYARRSSRPIAAVLPDTAEDAFFRGHGWVLESHDADTLFQIAGVAAARRSVVSRRDFVAPQPPLTFDEDGDRGDRPDR